MKSLLKESLTAFRHHHSDRFAAATAYYAVFCLIPLLFILLGVLGLVLESASIESGLKYWLGYGFDPNVARFITDSLNLQGSQSLLFTLLGILLAFLGASAVFHELQDALNTIFEAPKERSGFLAFLPKHFFFLSLVLLIGAALFLSFSTTIVLQSLHSSALNSSLAGINFFALLNHVFAFAVITLFVMLLYTLLPHKKIPLRFTLIGGILTASFFTLGKIFFVAYSLGTNSGYGAAGSLLLLLLWIFYNTQIFLFGAELTAQIYRRSNRS